MTESELLNLIFVPGFSTAEKITHFSGRGIGMDVVRAHIERIGGTVSIDSRLGRGTTVRMKIPLTLAIIPALTITSGGERYAIPQVSLQELVRPDGDPQRRGVERIHGAPVYRLRGHLLPLIYLNRELGLAEANGAADSSDINIVVLQADDRQFGLVVDAIHDTEEIVVKPLQKQVKGIRAFAGATIMGDGRVALILDVLGLAQRANVIVGVRDRALNDKATAQLEGGSEEPPLLLFATQDGARMAIPLSQVARLEEFPRSAIERSGTQEVVQYRNEILPLLDMNCALAPAKRKRGAAAAKKRQPSAAERLAAANGATVQVVVYAGGQQRVGLVVDKILDIVKAPTTARARAKRPGVLFTAVIQERVTEFLDIETILRNADPEFFQSA
jgi:two-component system chemotaxis sensor kinase CheA